jgi:hypothetical protein
MWYSSKMYGTEGTCEASCVRVSNCTVAKLYRYVCTCMHTQQLQQSVYMYKIDFFGFFKFLLALDYDTVRAQAYNLKSQYI